MSFSFPNIVLFFRFTLLSVALTLKEPKNPEYDSIPATSENKDVINNRMEQFHLEQIQRLPNPEKFDPIQESELPEWLKASSEQKLYTKPKTNLKFRTKAKRNVDNQNYEAKSSFTNEEIEKKVEDMDLTDNPDILVALFINILKNKYPEKLIEMKEILDKMVNSGELTCSDMENQIKNAISFQRIATSKQAITAKSVRRKQQKALKSTESSLKITTNASSKYDESFDEDEEPDDSVDEEDSSYDENSIDYNYKEDENPSHPSKIVEKKYREGTKKKGHKIKKVKTEIKSMINAMTPFVMPTFSKITIPPMMAESQSGRNNVATESLEPSLEESKQLYSTSRHAQKTVTYLYDDMGNLGNFSISKLKEQLLESVSTPTTDSSVEISGFTLQTTGGEKLIEKIVGVTKMPQITVPNNLVSTSKQTGILSFLGEERLGAQTEQVFPDKRKHKPKHKHKKAHHILKNRGNNHLHKKKYRMVN